GNFTISRRIAARFTTWPRRTRRSRRSWPRIGNNGRRTTTSIHAKARRAIRLPKLTRHPIHAHNMITSNPIRQPPWLLLLSMLLGSALGAAERVPWTTSRVHGSPEPPDPYRVERAFPKLTFWNPLDAVRIPGTDRLVIVEQHGRLFSIPNDENCEQ